MLNITLVPTAPIPEEILEALTTARILSSVTRGVESVSFEAERLVWSFSRHFSVSMALDSIFEFLRREKIDVAFESASFSVDVPLIGASLVRVKEFRCSSPSS